MLTSNRIMVAFGILVVLSMVLTACGPQQQPVEIVKTVEVVQEVEKEVVKTQEVIVTQEVQTQVEVPTFVATVPFVLGDVRVRQAIAYCTDRYELIESVYPLVTDEEKESLMMHTFIPSSHWAYAGDENITIYDFDPEKGKALLEEAGWMPVDGSDYRQDEEGIELALKFTTTNAAFRQTWAAVFEQQMKNCGIRIVRLHAPASWWFGDTTGLARRDFELGAYAWVGEADPKGETIYSCDQIPGPDNQWEGQNNIGWCNPTASEAIKQAMNTLEREGRIEAYRVVQQEFTNDMVSLPVFNRLEVYAYRPDLQNFEVFPGDAYYNWNAQDWEIPGVDTIILGFTQEPASLFGLVEQAQSARVAQYLVTGFFNTGHNYDFQARMQRELPSLENGLAVNNDVEIEAGTVVYAANGDIVELGDGVAVKDFEGNTVDFAGEPITMKQMTVTYALADGLTWSDGVPVSQADLELGYKLECDRESGATTFITCDKIDEISFDGLEMTITWLPGVQDPLYQVWPFINFYPAHQVIAAGDHAGKTLAEVPAADWATLPEVAERPLGAGPYVLKEWEKGEKMVFEANPYFYLGEPKTKNIIISVITPENAEAQLLAGQVDILDSTTLTALTETLADAEEQGKITVLAIPSGTWEHIDMNLAFSE